VGPVEGIFDGHDLMVAVGLDDANLVGTNFLVYAKFINVSDSWICRFLRGEFGFGE